MTVTGVSLTFEIVVAILLAVMIVSAIKLNRRIVGLRQREGQLQDMIVRFNQASERAEASAATLKAVGTDAEKSLRATVGKAQALRDDLVFMIDRGDAVAGQVERSITMARSLAGAAASPKPENDQPASPKPENDQPANDDATDAEARSEAERELLRALRSTRSGR